MIIDTKYPEENQRISWLQLYKSAGVGPVNFFNLLNHFGCAKAALEGISNNPKYKIAKECEILKEIEKAAKSGIKILTLLDKDYPSLLAQINDAPPILYVKGHQELLNGKNIAIVGARNSSMNGKKIASTLAKDFCTQGFNIISGMARGIDAASHEGSIKSSIAVLGTGVDVCYPLENRYIYDKLSQEGAIISEFPLGTSPVAQNFPRRNRIISGLSLAVVVVEASIRSGSLITARLALEQGREVFAVPGSPLDSRSEGPNLLLKQGAGLVENAFDVLDNLGGDLMNVSGKPKIKNITYPKRYEESGQNTLFEEEEEFFSSELMKKVVENIGQYPVLVDELIRICESNYTDIANILIELELEGKIERHPGNKVSLLG